MGVMRMMMTIMNKSMIMLMTMMVMKIIILLPLDGSNEVWWEVLALQTLDQAYQSTTKPQEGWWWDDDDGGDDDNYYHHHHLHHHAYQSTTAPSHNKADHDDDGDAEVQDVGPTIYMQHLSQKINIPQKKQINHPHYTKSYKQLFNLYLVFLPSPPAPPSLYNYTMRPPLTTTLFQNQ